MTFGNGNADIEIIKSSGVGISINNSPKVLLENSDISIDSPEKQGIEKFLEKGGIINKVRHGMTATEYNITEKLDKDGKVKKGYSIVDYSEKDVKIKRGAKPKAKRFGR